MRDLNINYVIITSQTSNQDFEKCGYVLQACPIVNQERRRPQNTFWCPTNYNIDYDLSSSSF